MAALAEAFFGFCREGIYGFINSFYPDPKIICLVRHLPAVIASMEKIFRQNQHKSSPILNHATLQVGLSLL
jgi:hypothetical protein